MSSPSTKKFSGIFVSYRREDTAGHAGRLFDRLVDHFGRDRIFMDVDTIEPGEDFVTVIENAVSSCDVLIAIMGRNWLTPKGSGRLDNPTDFVRLEIATALRRDIRVIPVLVQRASLPRPQDLPEDLVKLTRRNAVELTDLRWQTDVEQLIGVMERVLTNDNPESAKAGTAARAKPAKKPRQLMLVAGVSLVLFLAAAIMIWKSQTDPGTSGTTTQATMPATPAPTQTPVATVSPQQSATSAGAVEKEVSDLGGLWKRDNGDVVKIERNGNEVTALMYGPSHASAARGRKRGEPAFEGLLQGSSIRGSAFLLFSAEDLERCPEFAGDKGIRFNIKLTLSEDGNTLRGERENFRLSNACNVEPLPSKPLTYSRLSR